MYLRSIRLLKGQIPTPQEYPFSIPALKSFDELKFNPKITFFVGENGSGKSTLMEAIAILMGFNAEGGSKNFNFSSTSASHSALHEYLKPVKEAVKNRDGYFLRAESFFNVASNMDTLDSEFSFSPPLKDSYGGKSLHHQSHGESFFSLLKNRFGGSGLYILDEPEAALSPKRQLEALAIFHRLVKVKSQFIISTHSPILMAYPNATIYQFSSDGIKEVTYEATENFQITRDFLNRKDKMLETIFSDE